jgi:hypothetical protein
MEEWVGWMGGRMGGWMGGRMGWMNGFGWMVGWMGGRVDDISKHFWFKETLK